MGKPPRLELVARVDLPVLEASAVATAARSGETRVAVVGDRTSEIAVTTYDTQADPGHGFGEWSTFDLAELDRWPLPRRDSQLEAVAVDGGSLIALMSEDPPLVIVLDTVARELCSRIELAVPDDHPLHDAWDDESSRGEGLVLLRSGRLLVAKEKRPPALIEFAPRGSQPAGVSSADFLGPEEPWSAPPGDTTFEAVAAWPLVGDAHGALGDVSAIAVGRDRSLWLLSDQSRSVGRLPLDRALDPGGGEITELAEVWRLPKKSKKPEGVAALDDRHVLIALDSDSTEDNGIVVRRP